MMKAKPAGIVEGKSKIATELPPPKKGLLSKTALVSKVASKVEFGTKRSEDIKHSVNITKGKTGILPIATKARSQSQSQGKHETMPQSIDKADKEPLSSTLPNKDEKKKVNNGLLPTLAKKPQNREGYGKVNRPEKNQTASTSTSLSNMPSKGLIRKSMTMKEQSKHLHLATCDEICEEESSRSSSNGPIESVKRKPTAGRKTITGKNCSSLEEWKKRNGVELNRKVIDDQCQIFIVSNGIQDIKNALLARGWVENTDQSSNFYDFKWAIKSKDVIFSQMQANQLVNHFSKNTMITTKSGLAKSLEKVNTFHDVDCDSFFPRCFNLNEPEDIEDFAVEYKYSYV